MHQAAEFSVVRVVVGTDPSRFASGLLERQLREALGQPPASAEVTLRLREDNATTPDDIARRFPGRISIQFSVRAPLVEALLSGVSSGAAWAVRLELLFAEEVILVAAPRGEAEGTIVIAEFGPVTLTLETLWFLIGCLAIVIFLMCGFDCAWFQNTYSIVARKEAEEAAAKLEAMRQEQERERMADGVPIGVPVRIKTPPPPTPAAPALSETVGGGAAYVVTPDGGAAVAATPPSSSPAEQFVEPMHRPVEIQMN